jgi:maleylacetate reductase
MTSFTYTSAAQQVIFGAGSLESLPAAVKAFGWQRLLLCTIPRFERTGLVERLQDLLGASLVYCYAKVSPHVPQEQVDEALALALVQDVDAVIGLGGGSPIGLAKAASLALETARTGTQARARFPTDQPLAPVIAIPTTYAGSEMTPIYGVTRTENGASRKVTVSDAKVTPKLALYDPQLTLDLPPQMTASSGLNALAHAVEAAYSITRNPLATAAALAGASHITRTLPQAVARGDDLEARTGLMLGAHLAATSIATTSLGLHHGLCHVLGGTAGVPHGIANAIILPHAMRFNADATAPELAAVARAMGLGGAGEAARAEQALVACAADHVYQLVTGLGLPQRLRDVGVAEGDLPLLARLALQSKAVQSNPKPITSATQTEEVLRAAW